MMRECVRGDRERWNYTRNWTREGDVCVRERGQIMGKMTPTERSRSRNTNDLEWGRRIT